jgi:N-acetyl sugar amidotransferase
MNDIVKRRCIKGLWDISVPGITFDENGISNYAKIQWKLMESYPRGQKGQDDWNQIVRHTIEKGQRKKYDCIVGVSGGVDSSYLLYLLKEKYQLRPLAVTLDNGWSSEIAVKNIKLITDALNVDLETYVIDYEEIKDLMRAYLYSGLPWADTPTDIAIKAVMYKIALQEGIKYVFRGNDFRTEGKQPREWTYSDDKQLRYIHKKFGKLDRLKTYPYLPFWKIIYSGFIKGIKDIRPYYYFVHSKSDARSFLESKFGWRYYGGHHHENIYTKFIMSYWLPEKFGIDKRIINLSAQVLTGLIEREDGLRELSIPALNETQKTEIKNFVLKKLDLSEREFNDIMKSKNKTYHDYPNYEKLLFFILKFFKPLISLVYPQTPMTFVEMSFNQRKIKIEKKRKYDEFPLDNQGSKH